MNDSLLATLLPFHLRFDAELRLAGFGRSVGKLFRPKVGAALADLVTFDRPRLMTATPASLREHAGKLALCRLSDQLVLRGAWYALDDGWLLASVPVLKDFDEAKAMGLDVDDFPVHEPTFEFLLAAQQLRASLSQAQRLAGKQRERNKELAHARDEAEQASKAKSLFLSTMSHEIRTPMNGIIGMLDVMRDSALAADQLAVVDVIDRSAENLLRIINDVLDLARIEAGKASLVPEPVNPALLLGDVQSMFQQQAQQLGLTLRTRVDSALPAWLNADGARLSQVLYNLVGNALKFTAEGSVIVRALSGEGGTWVLEVSDSGAGMDERTLEKVFEAFERADDARVHAIEGAGLGLSIVRSLVELMSGEVTAESTPGSGSTFRVTLPLQAVDAPEERLTEGDKGGLTGRVLVVDDNAVNRTVALAHLSALGLQAESADNGKQALASTEAEQFDLILMDIQMPVLDGFGATEQLRLRPGWTKDIPILALTAAVDGAVRQRCLDAGMNDVLLKPLRRDALARRLARFLSPQEPPSTPGTPRR